MAPRGRDDGGLAEERPMSFPGRLIAVRAIMQELHHIGSSQVAGRRAYYAALFAVLAACHGRPPPPQGIERRAPLTCPVGGVQELALNSLPAGTCEWNVDPRSPPPHDSQPVTDELHHGRGPISRRCSQVSSLQACALRLSPPVGGMLLYCKDSASRLHGPVELLFPDRSVAEQVYCDSGRPRGVHAVWRRGRLWQAGVPGDDGLWIAASKYGWERRQ